MSKTQFPLPKGVEINNIEIDVKNNLLTIVYEEEKKDSNIGKWFSYAEYVILSLNNRIVGFKSGKWWTFDAGGFENPLYKPADMKEVKKLLIKEAEKRGFKDGVMCKPPFKNAYKRKVVGELRLHERGSVIDDNENILFEPETGIWAEIVEEKKPLYVNQYGTEFFEGDEYCVVDKTNASIIDYTLHPNSHSLKESKFSSEAMTKHECLLWIADKLK